MFSWSLATVIKNIDSNTNNHFYNSSTGLLHISPINHCPNIRLWNSGSTEARSLQIHLERPTLFAYFLFLFVLIKTERNTLYAADDDWFRKSLAWSTLCYIGQCFAAWCLPEASCSAHVLLWWSTMGRLLSYKHSPEPYWVCVCSVSPHATINNSDGRAAGQPISTTSFHLVIHPASQKTNKQWLQALIYQRR